MKKLILVLLIGCLAIFGKGQSQEDIDAVLAEGTALYKSEMASWNGSDLFQEKFKDLVDQAGGYLSYTKGDRTNCLFFSKEKEPDILVLFSFDDSFDLEQVRIETDRKRMTDHEYNLFLLRKTAIEYSNENTLFKLYEKTNLNFIPLLTEEERKVYVLTGPQEHGVIIFGNDYLVSFNDKNEITGAKQLHQNIIGMTFEPGKSNQLGGVHSHSKETGELITPTDICTLMLYSKYADWSSHIVIAPNYVNLWSCKTSELEVMTTKEFKKLSENIAKSSTETPEEVATPTKKKSKKRKKKNKQ